MKTDSNGQIEYRLSNLNVVVHNTALAPSDPANAQRFTADATIILEVPVSFAGNALPPLRVTLKVKAGWINLF